MRLGQLLLYARTMRHLRPVQLTNRVLRRLPRPFERLSLPAPPLRRLSGAWQKPIDRPARLVDATRIRLLEREGSIATAADWNGNAHPKLWLYQLHYFDDLGAPAARENPAPRRQLIERWIAENEPGRGIGWDPYPVSLRVRNWIRWHLSVEPLSPAAVQSLATQVRWLRPRLEYHLLANHLYENFITLVAAGCFFEGAEARAWYEAGINGLQAETAGQVLPDGGHFERSAMYQSLLLEALLDLVNLHSAFGLPVPAWLKDTCTRMLSWQHAMTLPDGQICQFNDAALDGAPALDALDGYAKRLGVEVPPEPMGTRFLEDTGFVRVRTGALTAILDLGPLGPDFQPAHGHADTLTFELAVGAKRVLADTGISTYEPGPQRTLERSTAVHNTIEIDGKSSSEMWGAFRVARRARVLDVRFAESGSGVVVEAAHDGYTRLPGRPLHARRWQFDAHGVEISDRLESHGEHAFAWRLHFAPGLRVEQTGNDWIVSEEGGSHLMRVSVSAPGVLRAEACQQHPGFGQSRPAMRLSLEGRFTRQVTIECRMALIQARS